MPSTRIPAQYLIKEFHPEAPTSGRGYTRLRAWWRKLTGQACEICGKPVANPGVDDTCSEACANERANIRSSAGGW